MASAGGGRNRIKDAQVPDGRLPGSSPDCDWGIGTDKSHYRTSGFGTILPLSPACSLTTPLGSLSSRSPANFECRRWSLSVHSKNSICATSLGRTQTHFFISSAVKPSPQRERCVSGRLTNGHPRITRNCSFSNTGRREADTNPFRTRAT